MPITALLSSLFQMQAHHRVFSHTKPKYNTIWQSVKLIVAEEGWAVSSSLFPFTFHWTTSHSLSLSLISHLCGIPV